MEKKRVIRLIIEDHEDVIYWDSDVDKPTLHELIVYIMDQFRKKYSTDTFSYRDFENKHYQIENIAEYEVTPIFINIPHRKDVQTFNKVDPRTYKNVYIFKDAFTVRVQKFESLKRLEEIEIKLSTIKETNQKNKDLKFEDPVLSADFGKLKIEIKAPEPVISNSASPSFGHKEPKDKQPEKAQPKQSGLLGGDKLETDISKRGNVALGEGKSQRAFMEIAQMNKNPTGKRVELQMYTIEDVKKHNRSNDAWMVINGKVYDVTQYIPFHPGGNKILMGVGKDGTELFNKYHPWVNANFLLEKYHIGFLKK